MQANVLQEAFASINTTEHSAFRTGKLIIAKPQSLPADVTSKMTVSRVFFSMSLLPWIAPLDAYLYPCQHLLHSSAGVGLQKVRSPLLTTPNPRAALIRNWAYPILSYPIRGTVPSTLRSTGP